MRRAVLTLRREDGRVVCESVVVADRMGRRLRGLLGRRALPRDQGLLLRPAWSIHTAFMRFPIDAVFLDHDQVVIRIEPGLRPFKTASCRGAREVVELSAGECERRGLSVGDRVAWAPRAAFDEGVSSESAVPPLSDRQGAVVIASSDPRFAKLARFLLDARGMRVVASVTPDRLVDALDDEPDVVVLDAADQLATTLRIANAARARRPRTKLVVVGEEAAKRAPIGLRVYHKWDETDDLLEAVENAFTGEHPDDTAPRALRSG